MNSKPAGGFKLEVQHVGDYEFRVVFDKETYEALRVDEPKPLGRDYAPNPARLLSAAVASCLCGSLVFCLSKANIPLERLSARVATKLVRNERNRLRIGKLDVALHPTLAQDSPELPHCLEVFEDFCVVTESVRNGIEVNVSVDPNPLNSTASPND